MLRRALFAVALLGFPLQGFAASWADATDDVLPGASEPALDLVGLTIERGTDSLLLTLSFNPLSATDADLEWSSGYVDFDVDADVNTGRTTHIEEFGIEPFPLIGIDYFLELMPATGFAMLWIVEEGSEMPIGDLLPISIDGSTLSVIIPLCAEESEEGMCLGNSYQIAVLAGNQDGPTDRAPDEEWPLSGNFADLDQDGDVDLDDFGYFQDCMSGPLAGLKSPECHDADLDLDGDVDQSDFGIFQVCFTEPLLPEEPAPGHLARRATPSLAPQWPG